MNHKPWQSIFDTYKIHEHDFSQSPLTLTAEQIKKATAHFTSTTEREVRVLCKQDTRESRPQVFVDNNLFILPIKNGIYSILQGEGYIDVPEITTQASIYKSKLDFELETSQIGNSEMQHLDFAYASSLVRSFLEDESLVLTIRGRKYTPKFEFYAGQHKQLIITESVQTEVDAGYEGRNQIVLIEAKNSATKNTIIRQLYYPFRQWQIHTKKKVNILFFEKRKDVYSLWEFGFADENNYNSIELLKSAKFEIQDK
ncbi:type II restriction enzyme [Hugenholtzia roseola]|uniref:type II restriction enzyme n=1 Tax=Hugenholtzia roseola TaxID=1002 RepID=UPI00040A2F6C|nr:hypothetical protein [Hugenholtzia roseola]